MHTRVRTSLGALLELALASLLHNLEEWRRSSHVHLVVARIALLQLVEETGSGLLRTTHDLLYRNHLVLEYFVMRLSLGQLADLLYARVVLLLKNDATSALRLRNLRHVVLLHDLSTLEGEQDILLRPISLLIAHLLRILR